MLNRLKFLGCQCCIGSRCDENTILPFRIHGDKGYARRIFFVPEDGVNLNAFLLEMRNSLLAEDICTNFSDKGDCTTGPRRSNRLIGSFATGDHKKLTT